MDAALVPRGLASGEEGQGIYRYPEFNKLRIDIEHAQKTGNGKGVVDAKDALKKWAKEKGININNDPDLLDLLSDSLKKEELEEIKTLVDQILEEKKGKKKKKGKKGKNSRGVFGYGFGYNNDDTVGDGDSDGVGISEGQDISDAVGEFFELMVNLPIHSSPPLYFWKELVDSSKIAKSAYDKNRGIGRN